MTDTSAPPNIHDPLSWARWEHAHNRAFWVAAEQNASGIFKRLCRFVLAAEKSSGKLKNEK